ncbi:triphosphoribosyl-dephospho-CoA synthase, partial [Cronobacter sakazakii]
RPAGLACEQAMFSATGGVNTHKGGIFSLGLLCAAAGRLAAQGESLTPTALCMTVSAMTRGIVARELAHGRRAATAGERLYRQFGLTGARGEVESGFATVRRHVLPFWQYAQGERGLQQALLRLMAVNPDTNLASRGGLEGLRYVQKYASGLLARGWDDEALREMDRALITRNLSPGGSADLLAVSWLLAALAL